MKNIKYSMDVKYVLPIVLAIIVVFRILSYGVFEFDTLYECFLCALYGIWGVSVWYRVTDYSCKRIFLLSCNTMMFWELIRTVKYHHLITPLSVRIAWYAFYIPMLTLSVLSFLISKVLQCDDSRKMIRRYSHLIAIAAVLILLVMTNEWHHLVFVFPEGNVSGNPDYTYGAGYFLIIGFILLMVIGCIANLIIKCNLPKIHKSLYIPLAIIVTGIVSLILYELGIKPVIGGITLFTVPDLICLFQILIWESCMYIGLIPANDGYYEIFASSSIGASILDKNGETIVCKSRDDYGMNDDLVVCNEPILGGMLSYVRDHTVINRQREELLEAREIIVGENLLIENENKLSKDRARYQKLNKVYDEIANCVHPRTVMVEELLKERENENDSFEKRLAKACFINAYIKRRSNLILQSKQEATQYVSELYLALAESVNYLGLSNIQGFVHPYRGNEKMPTKLLFQLYDFFQDAVESVFDSCTALMVDIRLENEGLALRLVLDTPQYEELLHVTKQYDDAQLIKEEDGLIAIIHRKKGGAL